MNIHQKIIPVETLGLDIDCVVADTMEAFSRLAQKNHGITIVPEQITRFNVEECLDIDKDIVDHIFYKLMIDPIKYELKLLPDALPVLQKLQRHAPLTFVTARPDKEPVVEWLTHELGKKTTSNMRVIAMGDHDGKTRHIKELGISHFIDDRFETCEDLHNKGITAIVYDQPWNHNQHTLPIVRNWQDIHDCCF